MIVARRTAVDDLGHPVEIAGAVRRVVSLVPSLTETVAVTAPGLVVGATSWCTHPAGLDVVRLAGTKNPDLDGVAALEPDLVLANDEENRAADVAELRARGLPVWVTAPRTVPAALASLARLLAACGLHRPAWLDAAERAWPATPVPAPDRQAVVLVWRRPWMALGRDTFAGDVLARLGVQHVLAGSTQRYPRVTLDEVRARRPDLVVLPDEPYAFGTADLAAFAGWGVEVAFVSGRHLTWYGPSLVEAPGVLRGQLAATVAV